MDSTLDQDDDAWILKLKNIKEGVSGSQGDEESKESSQASFISDMKTISGKSFEPQE